jgi:methyl-accepting chemotaxis protein
MNLEFIIEWGVPVTLFGIYTFLSISWILKAKNKPNEVNNKLLELIPSIYTTIGILCTFAGITYGFMNFDEHEIEKSIPILVGGLKSAFIASMFGISASIISSKVISWIQNENEINKYEAEKDIPSKEELAIKALNETLTNIFISKDENGNEIKAGNVLQSIYNESVEQTRALKLFSNDLATQISAGFETILNNEDKGVLTELKQLNDKIERLIIKTGEPTSDIGKALEEMMANFKESVSGNTKNEMEGLATVLAEAGKSLNSLPATIQLMTQNLSENFRGLQTIIEQISKNTLDQSTESINTMRSKVDEMAKVLNDKIGHLQTGHGELLRSQSENLTVSDKLLQAFSNNIDKMNALSSSVNTTLNQFDDVQNRLSSVANSFAVISTNVNNSSDSLKNAQTEFSNLNKNYVQNNTKTIAEITNTLTLAQNASKEYREKFGVIESGLQSIFAQIELGLTNYSKSVESSTGQYLTKYSEALTDTAKSLVSASSVQENLLEELTELVSKIKKA